MLVNWRVSLEYRANFIFETLLSLTEVGMYLFYWKIFFSISSGIPGATYAEMAALVAFNHIIYAGADTLMGGHLWETGDLIVKGQLDTFLVQPKSAIYQIFFSGAQPMRAVQIVIGAALYFYIVTPSLHNIALFLFGFVVGTSIFISCAADPLHGDPGGVRGERAGGAGFQPRPTHPRRPRGAGGGCAAAGGTSVPGRDAPLREREPDRGEDVGARGPASVRAGADCTRGTMSLHGGRAR
jgi:hypothetical protein